MPVKLSHDLVVDVALRVGDAEGVDAVSMHRIGQELGVSAMGLYRHVGSKGELMAAIAERVLEDLDLGWADARDALDDWRSVIRNVVASWADLVAIHPRTVGLIYTERRATRADLMPAELILSSLLRAGFTPVRAAMAFRTVILFVDSVLLTAPMGDNAGRVDWQGMPAELLDSMPAVRAAAPFVDRLTYREIFAAGVTALIDGIATSDGAVVQDG